MGLLARTLTDTITLPERVPFMALDLLVNQSETERIVHLYRHDLESFFYILVWAATRYKFSTGAMLKVSELDKWSGEGALDAKAGFFYKMGDTQLSGRPSTAYWSSPASGMNGLFLCAACFVVRRRRLPLLKTRRRPIMISPHTMVESLSKRSWLRSEKRLAGSTLTATLHDLAHTFIFYVL